MPCTPLTNRTEQPTSTRSFDSFRRMVDRALGAAKQAVTAASSRDAEQQQSQSLHPLTPAPRHEPSRVPIKPDTAGGLLGGRGSGHNSNAALPRFQEARTGGTGKLASPGSVYTHRDPTPGRGAGVTMPKTLEGVGARVVGTTSPMKAPGYTHDWKNQGGGGLR